MKNCVAFGGLVCALGLLAGCSSSPTAAAPVPAVTYALGGTVAPGAEWTQCQFLQVPPEGYNVNSATVEWSKGNHHTVLYMTPYTSIPTMDLLGNTVDTSKVFNCDGLGIFNWNISSYVLVAQAADTGKSIDLPPGVALKLPAGSIMVLSVHQLNTTMQPIDAESKVNFFTIPDSEMKQEAGVMYFYNYFIDLPAHTAASAREVCPISKDVTLTNLQSHTHARGTSTVANIVDGDGNMMEALYQNQQAWDNAAVTRFPDGKQLKAGTGMDYQCNYQNDTDGVIAQGATAANEMCAMIGMYYPRDVNFEQCSQGGGFLAESTAARHIGFGTASCSDTVACLGNAKPFAQDFGASEGPCYRNSCPAASKPIKAVTDCIAALMPNVDPKTACADQLTACAASACQ